LILLLVIASTACSNGTKGSEMADLTVEDGRRTLLAHLEHAMSFVDMTDEPVKEDDTPSPCHDDVNAEPDKGRADIYFVVPVKFGTSWDAARAVEDGLAADGWAIRRNEGAPEGELMFSAIKDDYALLISGGKGDIGRVVIGGTSPCFPK